MIWPIFRTCYAFGTPPIMWRHSRRILVHHVLINVVYGFILLFLSKLNWEFKLDMTIYVWLNWFDISFFSLSILSFYSQQQTFNVTCPSMTPPIHYASLLLLLFVLVLLLLLLLMSRYIEYCKVVLPYFLKLKQIICLLKGCVR